MKRLEVHKSMNLGKDAREQIKSEFKSAFGSILDTATDYQISIIKVIGSGKMAQIKGQITGATFKDAVTYNKRSASALTFQEVTLNDCKLQDCKLGWEPLGGFDNNNLALIDCKIKDCELSLSNRCQRENATIKDCKIDGLEIYGDSPNDAIKSPNLRVYGKSAIKRLSVLGDNRNFSHISPGPNTVNTDCVLTGCQIFRSHDDKSGTPIFKKSLITYCSIYDNGWKTFNSAVKQDVGTLPKTNFTRFDNETHKMETGNGILFEECEFNGMILRCAGFDNCNARDCQFEIWAIPDKPTRHLSEDSNFDSVISGDKVEYGGSVIGFAIIGQFRVISQCRVRYVVPNSFDFLDNATIDSHLGIIRDDDYDLTFTALEKLGSEYANRLSDSIDEFYDQEIGNPGEDFKIPHDMGNEDLLEDIGKMWGHALDDGSNEIRDIVSDLHKVLRVYGTDIQKMDTDRILILIKFERLVGF